MTKFSLAAYIIFGSILGVQSQDFLYPAEVEPPKDLISKIQDSLVSVLSIDFTGDGNDDFICSTISNQIKKDLWITSDYHVVKEQLHYDAYFMFWFIQLDDDPELETYNAWGYPEGIDYYFVDYDYANKSEKSLCNINPVIIDSTQQQVCFWGYPWDISGIFMKDAMILTSIEHEISRDGAEIKHPSWQKTLPIVFFKGKSTQPAAEVNSFEYPRYRTIEQLVKAIKQ